MLLRLVGRVIHKTMLVEVMQVLTAFQSLILAVFLFTQKRGKRVNNTVLAVMLSLLAAQMTTNLLQGLGLVAGGITIPKLFAVLYGPLLYLYVITLVYRKVELSPGSAAHLVPFMVTAAVWAAGRLTMDALALVIFASIGTYLGLCFDAVAYYRGVLKATHSAVGSLTLSWLRMMLAVLALVFVLDVTSYFLAAARTSVAEPWVSAALFAALLVFVTVLVFRGLRHPELFQAGELGTLFIPGWPAAATMSRHKRRPVQRRRGLASQGQGDCHAGRKNSVPSSGVGVGRSPLEAGGKPQPLGRWAGDQVGRMRDSPSSMRSAQYLSGAGGFCQRMTP